MLLLRLWGEVIIPHNSCEWQLGRPASSNVTRSARPFPSVAVSITTCPAISCHDSVRRCRCSDGATEHPFCLGEIGGNDFMSISERQSKQLLSGLWKAVIMLLIWTIRVIISCHKTFYFLYYMTVIAISITI